VVGVLGCFITTTGSLFFSYLFLISFVLAMLTLDVFRHIVHAGVQDEDCEENMSSIAAQNSE
jgi:hypothetical protein